MTLHVYRDSESVVTVRRDFRIVLTLIGGELDEVLEGLAALADRTTPTDEERRDEIAKVIMEADRATLDYERRWPDSYVDEQFEAYRPHADAVIAALRAGVGRGV